MLQKKLNTYLGKKVRITFPDDYYGPSTTEGILHKCSDDIFKNDINIYSFPFWYICGDERSHGCLFRSSHVKRIEVIK